MPHLTDENLMAWADGELDADTAARVEVTLREDAQLRERGLAMRRLSQQLRAAFADELAEPVPDHLMRAALGAAPSAEVKTFPIRQMASNWVQWGGLAAGIMLVVWSASLLSSDRLLAVESDGRVVADGVLAETLSQGLTSQVQRAGVRLHLSFKDIDGRYCRAFSAPVGSGLACRDARRWQVVVLSAPSEPREPDREMRLAGNELPQAVLEAAQHRIAGSALDDREEREARDQAWQR